MSDQIHRPPSPERLSKPIAMGLLIAVVFTALAHGAVEPWSVFIFEIIVLALILLWAIKAIADRRLKLKIPEIALPLIALVALGLAQSISFTSKSGRWLSLSMDTGATRATVIVLIYLLITLLIAANFFTRRERLLALGNFLVIFGLAMAVFALVQHFAWNGRFYWLRPTEAPSPFGPFANHNHFAGYMELLIPVPIGLLIARVGRGEMRLLYGFAALMMSIALMVSLSRGGMISLAATIAFLVLMSSRLQLARSGKSGWLASVVGSSRLAKGLSQAAMVVALLALIGAGIFWLGADPVISRVAQGQAAGAGAQPESFFSSRGWVWRDTLTMIRANPVFGVGLGAYGTAFPVYSESDGSLRVPQAHNDYLQIVADGGILGGLIALWFLAYLFRAIARGTKSRDPLCAGLALGAGAGIFAILVHSIFDFNLQLPSNALLFLLLSAVASHIGAVVQKAETTALARQAGERVRAAETASATGLVRGAS